MKKSRNLFNLTVNEKLEKAIEKSVNDTELRFNVAQEDLSKAEGDRPKLNEEELEQLLQVLIKDCAKQIQDRPVMAERTMIGNAQPMIRDVGSELPVESEEDDDLACLVHDELVRRMAWDKNLHAAIRACEMDKEYVDDVLEGRESEEDEIEKANLEDKPAETQQEVKKTLEQELDELMHCLKSETETNKKTE